MPKKRRKAQAIIDGAEMTSTRSIEINIVPDDLRGLDRFEARKRVIEQITAEGLAVMVPADHPDVAWMKGQAPDWQPARTGDRPSAWRRGGCGAGDAAAGGIQEDHAAVRRPLEGRHRADADGPVVRRRQDPRGPGAEGGSGRRHQSSCRKTGTRPITTG